MNERYFNGIKDAARFAIQPNMYRLCGEKSSQQILRDVVTERDPNYDLARETLQSHGFPHLNSFLGAIAKLCEQDIYDDEVVMSYWIGSYLTEKVGVQTKDLLVENYSEQISKTFGEQLQKILPEEIYLTHLSQVALILAGMEDQPEKSRLINHCMIAGGKILEVDMEKKVAKVNRDFLKVKDTGGYEVTSVQQAVKIDIDLTPSLEVGDDIAVHLGYLAAKTSIDEAERLKYWTQKVAALI